MEDLYTCYTRGGGLYEKENFQNQRAGGAILRDAYGTGVCRREEVFNR